MPYLAAYLLTYVAGIGLSYALNSLFVFKRRMTWSGLVRFPLAYLVQFALGAALIAAFVELFNWSEPTAALPALVLTLPITFLVTRYLIARPVG